MYNTLVVHEPNRVADVAQDRRGLVLAQCTSFYDVVEKFATRQKFRDQIQLVLVDDRVLEAHDVGVPASL